MLTSDDAAAALARVDALHTALTQSVLEGGDLDRIAAEVAGVLGVGILVTSTDGRERAAGGMSPDLRAALGTAGLVDPTRPAARGARDRGGDPSRHRASCGCSGSWPAEPTWSGSCAWPRRPSARTTCTRWSGRRPSPRW